MVCTTIVLVDPIEAQLRREPELPPQPHLVYALIDQFVRQAQESGATEEEMLAALRSAELIVPLLGLESRHHRTIRT